MNRSTLPLLLALIGCSGSTDDSATTTKSGSPTGGTTNTGTEPDECDFEDCEVVAAQATDGLSFYSDPIPYEYRAVGSATVVAGVGVTGTVEYTFDYDGVRECDSTTTFAGTPYTGDCRGCDFAFDIDETATSITRDESTKNCYHFPLWTLVEDDSFYDLKLAWTTDYTYTYTDPYGTTYDYTYQNSLSVGYLYNYYYYPTGGYYELGPYWRREAFYDPTNAYQYNDASYYLGALAWDVSIARNAYDYIGTFYYYCGPWYFSYATENYGGTYTGTGSVDCDGRTADIWTVEAVSGQEIAIAVDTTSAATTFDPRIYVRGPSECFTAFADDNFECTFPPPEWMCPSVIVDAEEDGPYEIQVFSVGDCDSSVSPTVDYSITIGIAE